MGSEGEEEGDEEEGEVGCGCEERRVVGSHGEVMVLCFGFRDLESCVDRKSDGKGFWHDDYMHDNSYPPRFEMFRISGRREWHRLLDRMC